jgi:hypothetical protein
MKIKLSAELFRHPTFETAVLTLGDKAIDLGENHDAIAALRAYLPMMPDIESVELQTTERDYHFDPPQVKVIFHKVYSKGVLQ